MIYILHGDDTVSSRKGIEDIGKGFKLKYINGLKSTLGEIMESISSQSLFGEKEGFVIENFLSKKRKLEEMMDMLSKEAAAGSLIIFWEGKLLGGSLPKQENVQVLDFKLPKYYFQFLDGLYPSNSKELHRLYEDLLKTMSPEQVYYSIIKRVRQLIIVEDGKERELEETARLAPWQLSRLKGQSARWQGNALVDFHNQLFDTEVKMKSSGLPTALGKYIDILILSDLN